MEDSTSLVEVPCNLCGSTSASLIAVQSGWRMMECARCGLAYVNPRPDEAGLLRHYQTYRPPGTETADDWEKMMAPLFGDTVRRIARLVPPASGGEKPQRLLDAGCAHGGFLARMTERGWAAEGIDLSAGSVAAARARGLNVRESTLEEARFPDASFDAVTAFYVLEHVTDPAGFLREVRRILSPGGLAVIRVPHTTPLVRVLGFLRIPNALYDMPSHLFDFSPGVLGRMLEETGFEIVETTPQKPTLRPRLGDRWITYAGFAAAMTVHALSNGRRHFPGVSTTTFARRRD